jgi:protocadherin delta 1
MTQVVRVRAVDRDVGPNGHVTYSFSESTTAMYGHLFAVNAQTGEVYVTGSIDSDDGSSSFHLVIVARDSGPDAVDTSATINVEVRDVNDNAPMVTSIDSFIAPSSSSSSSSSSSGEPEADAVVLENSKAGTFIAQMTVVDPDLGNNGRFNCSLKSADGGGADRFLLKRMYDTEFQLVTTSPLDREVRDFYNVTVECTDFGSPPMTSHRLINIVVGDVNDNVPSFDRQRYVGELFENNYIGAVVVQTSAIDMDLGNNSRLIYSLSGPGSELFAIEPTSGLITAAASLDRESTPQVSFRVVAADSGNPSLVGSSLVFVTVLDVNDNRPQFVFPGSSSAYSFEVAENQPVGTVVGQISAGDRDSGPNQLIEYRLLVNTPGGGGGGGSNAGGGSLFLIDPVTGVLTTGQPLDREQVEKHVLTVVAVDRGTPSLSSTATAAVTVLDVNDNAPEFDFPSTADAEGDTVDTVAVSTAVRPGTVVARLVAHDADTGVNSRIAYGSGSDTMSVPFRVDPDTGYLLVDGDLSQSDGKRYSLVVTASDYRGLATSTVLHVVVNASLAAVAPDHIDGDSASTASTSGLFVGSSMVSGVHLIAVVCLAVGSGTATVALIIAIAIIRRRRGCCCCSKGSGKRGRGARHYNCRTAACMRLSQTSTTSPVWNQTTASPTVNGKPVCQDKEVIEYVVVDATNRTATTFGSNLYGGSSNDTTGSGSLIGYGDRTGMAGANNASSCCCCCTVSGGSADCERCGSRQRLLQSCTALSGTNDQMNKVNVC